MKIRIGYGKKEYGTVESTSKGLVYDGQKAKLRSVIAGIRAEGQSDEDLLKDIPRQLNNGYWWSQDVADEALTQQH